MRLFWSQTWESYFRQIDWPVEDDGCVFYGGGESVSLPADRPRLSRLWPDVCARLAGCPVLLGGCLGYGFSGVWGDVCVDRDDDIAFWVLLL